MSYWAWNCRDEECPDPVVAIGIGQNGQMYAMCPSCMASQINDQAGGLITDPAEMVTSWSGTHILTERALKELFGDDEV